MTGLIIHVIFSPTTYRLATIRPILTNKQTNDDRRRPSYELDLCLSTVGKK